eukprot:6180268-Pleurochrysis_carterae.AAC.4
MVVNGIAVRLGIAPEAARDTRGFGTVGNPRNGLLSVGIPPHFWERLENALSDNANGFEFFTLFPPNSDVPDRSPVTMFAKRASDKAVTQSAQKGPKVKLPWISFKLPSAYMALGNKACVATKVILESMGFEIPSIPRIARDERGNLKNLLHAEFTDYSENTTLVKWHKWSRYTRGMPIMCEGYTLHTPIRGFADGFLSKVLKAKKRCFLPLDKFCTCQDLVQTRDFRGPSTSAKAVNDVVSEELNAIQALYAKKKASSIEAILPDAQGNILHVAACLRKLRVFYRKRDFARAQIYQIWDSTLGYPGEGPPIKFASVNLRGGVTSRQRWSNALTSFRSLNLDFVAIQEHNLRNDSKEINSRRFLANSHGYVFFFTPLPKGKRVGGASILVKNEVYASMTNPRFRSHRSGGFCTLSFYLNDHNLRFASISAPADARERVSFFHVIRNMIDSTTILCGDFNCVDDPSVDTRRSSDLKYSNEGADILSEIVTRNSLRDEIREQMGLDFDFTHSQKMPTGGYCLTRLDRHYLPDLSNCQWTSDISDSIDDTDHSLVQSTLTFANESDQTRGRDLFTINPQTIHLPEVRKLLILEINNANSRHKTMPHRIQQTVYLLKYNI